MTKEQTFDMKSTIMLRNLFFSLQKATEKRLSCAQRHEGALRNQNNTHIE